MNNSKAKNSLPQDKELSMETRQDKSSRQILVEEAVLSSSTEQESDGEEQPLRFRRRRGSKGRSQGSESRKVPPYARKVVGD
ncbi:hypothetical protein DUI87_34218 [Hirundo rustica rustica]|uniref:Uncharacterized protein n=1 Tax=Hirundo rustica rustica TaxID=333673 RepID=A0A3M0IIS0_HIRRU|nr:hypothetical protein DUI87_34218 [Hirundo rustica rustica]